MTTSVVVCTRDRAASCARTVESLLSAQPAPLELVVVDQGREDELARALAALPGAERVTVIRSRARGLSAARNEGIRACHGDIVLFTDDDCLIDPAWPAAWERALAAAPEAGVGFGQVSCPPFDPAQGYTAGFDVRPGRHRIDLFRLGAGQVGMGANMAVRRGVWSGLGGFDEGLGAGARFPSAEDSDFAYRAVRAGYEILHVREARVWHLGHRSGGDASHLMHGYVSGIAAMYTKHVRCGDATALRFLLSDLGHHLRKVAHNLPRRVRPSGLGGTAFYLRGIVRSYRSPVDSGRRVYRIEAPHG